MMSLAMSKRYLALTAALALTGLAVPAKAIGEPMNFRLMPLGDPNRCGSRCAQAIVADGEIIDTTPQQFLSFVDTAPQGNFSGVVLLNSSGGKVVASMELGQAFRKLGIAAIVSTVEEISGGGVLAGGRCYSACVYALMGARKRVIPAQSKVGIHRMFQYERALDPVAGIPTQRRRYDTGSMHAMLSRYSNLMGVNSGIVDYAERSSTDSIHVLSKSEIARWRLGQPKL